MIRVENVTKIYGAGDKEVTALEDVNLHLEPGEFVAIRGPSGSGKSTLLLTAAGMIRPTAGKVSIDGTDLYSLSASRRARLRLEQFGFVFQMFHLIPYLSALENVQVPMYISGRPRGEQRKRARKLLERVGLDQRIRHRPEELSVGERQRVAIARALANQPQVIFADEPTGNLDEASGSQVMELFRRLNAESITILVVTHDARVADSARRRLLLEGGALREETTPA